MLEVDVHTLQGALLRTGTTNDTSKGTPLLGGFAATVATAQQPRGPGPVSLEYERGLRTERDVKCVLQLLLLSLLLLL